MQRINFWGALCTVLMLVTVAEVKPSWTRVILNGKPVYGLKKFATQIAAVTVTTGFVGAAGTMLLLPILTLGAGAYGLYKVGSYLNTNRKANMKQVSVGQLIENVKSGKYDKKENKN